MNRLFNSLFIKYLIIYVSIILVTSIIGTSFAVYLFDNELPIIQLLDQAGINSTYFIIRNVLVTGLFGVVFVFLATRAVVKPIKKLSKSAKEVSQGNFEIQVERKNKCSDEISILTDNFNLMVKELSRNEYLHKDFVSNVSHEFKTPIAAIQGYAEMLISPKLSEEKRMEYAKIILRQTERLSKLSSNMLRLSELENESMITKKTTFSLDEQIRDAIILLQSEWEQKNINMELALDEVSFTGDKALMYQVWVNILGNAIKYSNKNGKVSIMLSQEDDICAKISDNGIGMTNEQKLRVFDRFYKVDDSRTNNSNGLGLSIAKRIVELHGGNINVESSKNKGSSFIVRL